MGAYECEDQNDALTHYDFVKLRAVAGDGTLLGTQIRLVAYVCVRTVARWYERVRIQGFLTIRTSLFELVLDVTFVLYCYVMLLTLLDLVMSHGRFESMEMPT